MKTNKMIAAWLAATAIMTLSFGSTFAMWGHGNGWGQLSQYVTAEEKAELQSLPQEERQAYMNELKSKYRITSSQGGWHGKWQSGSKWGHGSEDHNPGDMIANIPASDLTDKEEEILIYGYEEERLARDVYNYLADLYPEEEVFSKIASSEQKHMDSVEVLLDRYDMEVPTGYGELQSTVDTLKAQGEKSLKDALEVGLQIEVLDIEDIEDAILNTDNDDFKVVFTNIGGASYNHMRSFLKAFDSNWLTPDTDTSEFLSTDDLDVKWPLKYKLAERLEAEGIVLPEQVNSETLKSKGPNSGSHGKPSKGTMWKGKWDSMSVSLNGSRVNVTLKNQYKTKYEAKYGSTIAKMTDSQLETFIGKVDDIIEKVNTGDYSEATKEKYNAMLIALKEIAINNIDEESILDGLFN